MSEANEHDEHAGLLTPAEVAHRANRRGVNITPSGVRANDEKLKPLFTASGNRVYLASIVDRWLDEKIARLDALPNGKAVRHG